MMCRRIIHGSSVILDEVITSPTTTTMSKQNTDAEVEDPRFAGYKNDPRWKRMPKKSHQVEIGDRFQKIFTDKAFTKSCILSF